MPGMADVPDRNDPIVKCPACELVGRWFSGTSGPFCSPRCRLVDLGKWFNEEHRLVRELRPGDFEGDEAMGTNPHPDAPGTRG
jgi:endogenous inhibitor of DNA gyrase (YacG/DUF329 family)